MDVAIKLLPDDNAGQRLDVDTERAVHAEQRIIDRNRLLLEQQLTRRDHSTWYIAGDAFGLLCSVMIMKDAYRAAHPMFSPIRPYTKSKFICKMVSPYVGVGAAMAAFSVYQLTTQVLVYTESAALVNEAKGLVQVHTGRKYALMGRTPPPSEIA